MSALITGTPAYAAISSIRSWPKVRQDDGGTLPAQHLGDVGDRLPLPDLGQPAVDDHREATELDHAGAERGLGAQRRLVEQQRGAARTGKWADLERVGLEGVGQVQHGGLLGRGEVVVGQEVAEGHLRAPSSRPGSTATKESSWSAVTTSGGASRVRPGAER